MTTDHNTERETDRDRALKEFWTMLKWISLAGVLLAGAALWYLSLDGPLRLSTVIGTVIGVFLSMLLGCGLFAAAFFSDKSGHDQNVTDATRSQGHDEA